MLQLQQVSKEFPGVKALIDVSFGIQPGEIHALCGENGAGKSTLMNILSGNLLPDSGEIHWQGQAVRFQQPLQARQQGISIVYQERSLIDSLSVAENIFAGNQPVGSWGFIDFRRLYAQTRQLLADLHLSHIAPETPVAQLSPGQKQLIELAKALSQRPQLLILDEPTASISEAETQVLFGIIRRLKAEGVGVIYISHRMKEIFEIAERVSVLKDGRYQGTFATSDLSINDVIRLMVGRELRYTQRESHTQPTTMLAVQNLSGKGFEDISFGVNRGEVVGLAGLVGAGRTEIARAIMGDIPKRSGHVEVAGHPCRISHPLAAIRLGIGYVSEERKANGLFLEMSLTHNATAVKVAVQPGQRWLNGRSLRQQANQWKQKLNIKAPDLEQKVLSLSGGNQQKVVLAKWLMMNPKVLIVDEPTHGVDVGAKAEIYELLHSLTQQGVAILLISSELTELLTLADRILVLHQGRITAELDGPTATEAQVMRFAAGFS